MSLMRSLRRFIRVRSSRSTKGPRSARWPVQRAVLAAQGYDLLDDVGGFDMAIFGGQACVCLAYGPAALREPGYNDRSNPRRHRAAR